MTLVSVYKAAGQLEAEMIKAFLEAQDIPTTLNQESIGRTIGLSAGRLGEVQVLVHDDNVVEARALLKEMSEGKFDLGDDDEQEEDSPEGSENW